MAKTPFLFGNDTVADGKHRKGGKIYAVEAETAGHLHRGGRGRAPSEDELARLGVEPDPDAAAGEHVRDMGVDKSAQARREPGSSGYGDDHSAED